ncbi:MAG: hypothetical protein ABIG39_01460 [Candidatus Micrarchaeota archaeon]
MKILYLLLCAALLPTIAFTISVTCDKESYTKGESIHISGKAVEDGVVEVTIFNGPRRIYVESMDIKNNTFSTTYAIRHLDPQGEWNIVASAPSGKSRQTVDVSPTPEGAYYLVKFTSPPYQNVRYLRTDTLSISVSVLDSGKVVSGAKTNAWVGENSFGLTETSSGTYQGEYIIPNDLDLGPLDIYVIVEKSISDASYGGEKSLQVDLVAVPIHVEFISPGINAYQVGEKIPIEISLTYPTGRLVTNSTIVAKANEQEFLIYGEGNVFSGEYEVREEDTGILKIAIDVRDSGGNKGYGYRNIEIRGVTQQAFIDYYGYLVAGAVLLLLLAIIGIKRFMASSSLEKLEKERENIVAREKALQQDYIKEGSIDRDSFERRTAEYESKISELDEKIKRMKQTK